MAVTLTHNLQTVVYVTDTDARRGHAFAPHARARSTRVTDPNNPPSARAVRGGGAPDLRRPS